MGLTINLNDVTESSGVRTLTLLAEELGYANFGFRGELFKGIHGGTVQLDGEDLNGPWKMRGGLAGEHLNVMNSAGRSKVHWDKPAASVAPGTWYQTSFITPKEVGDGANSTQLLLQ